MNLLKALLFLVLTFLLYEGFGIGFLLLAYKDDLAVFCGVLVCLVALWLWIYVAVWYVRSFFKEKTDEAFDDWPDDSADDIW